MKENKGHRVLIGERESGQRLDKFLRRYLPGASAGFLYKMLRKKNITVNGKKAEGPYLLAEGDSVEIYFSEETLAKFQQTDTETAHAAVPESVSLDPSDVLFENDELLLVNKPAGVLSQKAEKKDISLTEQVCSYLSASGRYSEKDQLLYRPGPANRLDRNTSGIMIFPLSAASARELSAMLKERTLKKEYLTLVRGSFPEKTHLRSWFTRDPKANTSTLSRVPRENAVPAELICEPLQEAGGYTLLKIDLLTGKTHQIRAQLAACGYPVAGDRKYGKIGKDVLNRQFLHSWKLTFPETSGILRSVSGRSFTAPLPADLRDAAGRLGFSEAIYR